jgi:UPF0755 protein
MAAVIVLILAGAAAGFWFWRELHAPGPMASGGALVSIAPGEAFRSTCARLQQAGVVRNGWVLRLWGRWTGEDRAVRSGDYRFTEPLSPVAVLARLQSPTAALHSVTIPEGSTLRDVAALLARAGFGSADAFWCVAHDAHLLARLDVPASGLEGYLFPDTYAFAWGTPMDEILAVMVDRFREQTGPLQTTRLNAGMSEEEMVTLASIVEKETGAAQERPLVSAVFHNRLRLGMPLQADPTTVYGRDTRGGPTAADLDSESPYNTYLHRGLPPGPICNPGRAALEAAVSPAREPYLYFVARNDGTHSFSRTLEEHNRAVARFRRGPHDGAAAP